MILERSLGSEEESVKHPGFTGFNWVSLVGTVRFDQGSTELGVNDRQCSPAFGYALGIPSLPPAEMDGFVSPWIARTSTMARHTQCLAPPRQKQLG